MEAGLRSAAKTDQVCPLSHCSRCWSWLFRALWLGTVTFAVDKATKSCISYFSTQTSSSSLRTSKAFPTSISAVTKKKRKSSTTTSSNAMWSSATTMTTSPTRRLLSVIRNLTSSFGFRWSHAPKNAGFECSLWIERPNSIARRG